MDSYISAHGRVLTAELKEMKYAFVEQHAREYPITLKCRLFDLHRSAYYDWVDRGSIGD